MKKFIGIMLLVFMLIPAVYADSTPSSWAQEEYEAADNLGLVIPEVDDNFQDSIKRKAFCKLIVNMVEKEKGEEIVITEANPFLDVNDDDVTKAYQLGIVNGVSETKFAPERLIKRQEIAAMMMRAARKLDSMNGTIYTANIDTSGISFADQDEISDWAINDIKELNKLGLMKGVGGNKIGPLRPTKIEEGILLTYRLYKGYTDAVAGANAGPEAAADPVELTVQETVELVIPVADLATDADGDALEIKKVGDTDLEAGTPVALAHGEIVLDAGSLKYTSNDLDETKVEAFVVTVSDSQEEVEVNVKITVEDADVLAAKPDIKFETPENTALEIAIEELVVGYSENAKITLFGHKQGQDILGSTAVSADRRSATYTPTKDVTKNETEVLTMKVTDGDDVVEFDVTIKVTEVGNTPPQKVFVEDFFMITINEEQTEQWRLVSDIVVDTDDDDSISVKSISYWQVGPFPPGPKLTYVRLVESYETVFGVENVHVLKAGPAVIGPGPGGFGGQQNIVTDYKVVFTDGTDDLVVKVRAKKIRQ